MPSVNDIVELAQALETKPILILGDKCVAVRNRNAKCTRCIDACPIDDTITIARNVLDIDFAACAQCGACTAVCPTEALVALEPMDADLAIQVADACIAAGQNHAYIGCARISSKHVADPHTFAEVPCLCRVDESLILGLAAHGVEGITLVDGVCKTCKYRATRATTDAMMESVNDLLATWGSSVRVDGASEFPAACALKDERRLHGEERRNFFAKAKQGTKEAATKAAVHTLKLEEEQPSLKERLKVGAGKMPQFEAVRRMNMLDSLDAIGQPQRDAIDTRLWGRVEIDTESCNACGMCAVFCPTGALVKLDAEKKAAADDPTVLEFSCSACVQCGLCADACFKGSLTVSPHVQTGELLDFEPRIIEVHGGRPKDFLGGSR